MRRGAHSFERGVVAALRRLPREEAEARLDELRRALRIDEPPARPVTPRTDTELRALLRDSDRRAA